MDARNKMPVTHKKGIRIFIPIILLMLFCINTVQSEDPLIKAKYQKTADVVESGWTSSRSYSPGLFKSAIETPGWQQYVRLSKHDGNLVSTGFVNQGQLADGYISGPNWPMIWPKGSGTEYGYAFVFFVAGEVVDVSGNTIHICSDRFQRSSDEQSPDGTHWYVFMPLPKYFNNRHLGSLEWDVGGISEDFGVDGFPNTNDFGEGDGELQAAEDFNRNGVLDLSLINVAEWAAMSHLRETWPEWWPPQSYNGDDRAVGEERPGPAAGRWNGEYGYYTRANQESYYVMDDHENDEFEYYPFNLPGTDEPDTRPWPDGKRGLGVTVEVRNYQWSARLAEDILISIYDITNYGKKINKAVIGMYSDVDVGGTSGGDDSDFDTIDDITYVWDISGVSNQGLPTGFFGFAFLESPGLSDNRKDDDQDGLVDESQYNSLDEDLDWRIWEDENNNGVYDNEDTNYNGLLDNGEDLNGNGKLDWEPLWDDLGSDGLGPEFEGYPGPDDDNSEANGMPDQGEPNFGQTDNDESDQVGLTSWYLKDVDSRVANDEEFWQIELQPGTFEIDEEYTRDVAFDYGSGFVELESGRAGTQRYAIACLFGNDELDIFRNKRTMQKIYDSDYNFAKAPRLPVVTAIPGSNKVVLLWDDSAEQSRDPIYGRDFAMYKLYKSTDPNFSDIKTISDAFGNPLLFEPLVQYDLKDGLFGPHPIPIGGSDDSDGLDLGVSYDMGTDSGLKHSYVDYEVTNGRTYYYAVVAVDKGYAPDFFERRLTDKENLSSISPTETSAIIQTDPLGRATFVDRNAAVVVPVEPAAGYLEPQTESGIKHISGMGTGDVELEVIIPEDIQRDHTYRLSFADDGSIEKKDSAFATGVTKGAWLVDMDTDDTLFTPDIDYESEDFEDDVLDGFKLYINNEDQVDVEWAGWYRGRSNIQGDPRGHDQQTLAVPHDYEVRILEYGADTSYSGVPANRKVTNFSVYDVTNPDSAYRIVFGMVDNGDEPDSLHGIISHGDQIVFKISPLVIELGQEVLYIYTETSWRINFALPAGIEPSGQILPQNGDVFRFTTKKTFDRYDVFEFKMIGGDYTRERAVSNMDNIYTVPDPYIGASSLEPRLISQDVGRGDRRIDFVNLPKECTINIFTIAGRLVRTLEHSAAENDGRAPWDLRTKDGLEIAHGIYIYHVDAPGVGTKIGKLAVIK
jgi:hypothetical protein